MPAVFGRQKGENAVCFWRESHLKRSSYIKRCRSCLERVGLRIILVINLPSKQNSCSTRSHEITNEPCTSSNYEKIK